MKTNTWKLKPGTTWRDKVEQEHPNHGKIVPANTAQRRKGIQSVLIARPLEVEAIIKKIPRGRLMTISQLRDVLARDRGADMTCPLTTGIFLRIIAEAAEEAHAAGRKRITPYWRVVDNNGGLKAKYPGGVRAQAKHLREEGMTISRAKGKKPPRVKEFESHLVAHEFK